MISSNFPSRIIKKQPVTPQDDSVDTVDAVTTSQAVKNSEKLLSGIPQSQVLMISSTPNKSSDIDNHGPVEPSDNLTHDTEVAETMLANAVDVLAEADIDIAAAHPGPIASETALTPNRTVQANDIEGLFYQSKLDFSVVGLDLVESTVLLLKSGLAYIGLRSSPLDLQVPENADSTESSWAQWRKEDDEYQLKNSVGEWRAIDGVQVDTTPLKPSDVAGNYSRMRTQNWGGTIFTDTENLMLTDSGEFLTSASSFVTSTGFGSLSPGSNIVVSTTANAVGSIGLAAAQFVGENATANLLDNEQVVDLVGNRLGNYELLEDGLTIEFRYGDGSMKRELFFRTSNKVFAGDRSYAAEGSKGASSQDFYDALYSLIFSEFGNEKEKDWLEHVLKAKESFGGREDDFAGIHASKMTAGNHSGNA